LIPELLDLVDNKKLQFTVGFIFTLLIIATAYCYHDWVQVAFLFSLSVILYDVYHFDTKDHVFEKADRFTERQKEKEAQAAKTEKAGKEQPDQKPKTKKHDMEL